MKMKILLCSLLIIVTYISSVACVSNTTYDSMKIGISHFNKAGNDFFNLIRAPLDPNHINIDDFRNFSLSLEQVNKGATYYLSYYILLVIGVVFAVLLPLIGLLLLCCCCCKSCGGKPTPMEPPNARCKIISYGLILAVLTTAMLFGTVICLLNNQIVHETVNNQDKSINIFVNLKSDFQNIKRALIEVNESINRAPETKVTSHQLQGLSNNLDDSIKGFYSRLVSVPVVLHVIDQTKSLKSVLDRQDVNKSQRFVQNLNSQLTNMSHKLATLKNTIKEHLIGCSTQKCTVVREKTDRLHLSIVNQTIIDKMNTTLDLLKNADFQSGLTKIIEFRENNPVNMKLILEGELKYIKDGINNQTFSDSLKKLMTSFINKLIDAEKVAEDNIPSLMSNETKQHDTYNTISTYESYRFYTYIGLCCVVLLIIVCYYLGLLFGTIGERPSEAAGCCNRGVGARFMTSAVVLTFLFSSIMMIVVIANMLTTGVAHTDMCRYTALKSESDAKVLDVYVDVMLNLTDIKFIPRGIVNALVNKCPDQNFYTSFSSAYRPLIIKNLEPHFKNIDHKIVSLVLSQINLTGYLNTNPFESTSAIDLTTLVNSIALLNNDGEMADYLSELSDVTQQYPNDVSDMRSLNSETVDQKTRLGLLVQYLNNSENEYIRLKMIGKLFDNNKLDIVKMKSPELLSSIQKSLLDILDVVFDEMFRSVSCQPLSTSTKALFNTVCQNTIDPMNGTWYGLGFYLILAVPALVFACLLIGIYRRISKFYPDKDETDYDNYIGFYARSDPESFRKEKATKKSSHKGYRAIPLQTMS